MAPKLKPGDIVRFSESSPINIDVPGKYGNVFGIEFKVRKISFDEFVYLDVGDMSIPTGGYYAERFIKVDDLSTDFEPQDISCLLE